MGRKKEEEKENQTDRQINRQTQIKVNTAKKIEGNEKKRKE